MTIRALIIDDEKLARSRLKRMLSRYSDIEIIGEARDGAEGERLVKELEPDVVFLDIKMPVLSGFDMLGKLDRSPHVIFVTAYDEYALHAFEENTIDYLLKPVSKKRLDMAVEKLTEALRRGSPADIDTGKLLQSIERRRSLIKRFSVTIGDRIMLIPDSDITFFNAESKCTFLHTAGKDYIIPFTMNELEDKLDPGMFVRVHRSYIVNLEHIESVSKWFAGRLLVRMNNGRDITVSRSYITSFKVKINL